MLDKPISMYKARKLPKSKPPQCEARVSSKFNLLEGACPFAARFELEDGRKVCGTHAKWPDPFPSSPRVYKGGELRLMVRNSGYCMVRKPGCVPFVLSEKEWRALPAFK